MEPDRQRRRREQRRRRVLRRRIGLGVAVAVVVALGAAMVLQGGSGPGDEATAPPQTRPTSPRVPDPPATAPAPVEAEPITLAAVGDIVMGSPPYGLPRDGGRTLFSRVERLLAGDLVLGNLEGTLATGGSSKCGPGSTSCFAFRTPPSYARWLKGAGFDVMSLANNHAFDFGPTAQRETVAALTRVGIGNTGRPGTSARRSVGGLRVTILGFAPYRWADSLLDIPRARARVAAAAKKADIVVVTFHGGAEGSDRTRVPTGPETFLGEPRGDTRAFARAVVDAGADLVIGHGPHVLRGMEIHRKRLIAYSLGNFMGYEVFSLGGPLSTSAVLQVTLNPDGTFRAGRIRPVQLVGAGVPAPGGESVDVLRRLSRQDFGAKAPRIGEDGTIRPRA